MNKAVFALDNLIDTAKDFKDARCKPEVGVNEGMLKGKLDILYWPEGGCGGRDVLKPFLTVLVDVEKRPNRSQLLLDCSQSVHEEQPPRLRRWWDLFQFR